MRREQRLSGHLLRDAINRIDAGLCMAEEDGTPILTNQVMNRIVSSLFGASIMNAELFWHYLKLNGEAVLAPRIYRIRLKNGQIWTFHRDELDLDKGRILQITAFDDTDIFLLQHNLQFENEHLSSQMRRQKELLWSIVRKNMQKDLLAVKMDIHGAFGNCLAATRVYLEVGQDEGQTEDVRRKERQRLLEFWHDALKSLDTSLPGHAKEDIENKHETEAELMKAAGMIGCQICFIGRRPVRRTAQQLYYAAVREALINAVRHHKATELTVETLDPEPTGKVIVRITDNGSAYVASFREGSGLGSLRRRLEEDHISLDVVCDGRITLYIGFREKDFVV